MPTGTQLLIVEQWKMSLPPLPGTAVSFFRRPEGDFADPDLFHAQVIGPARAHLQSIAGDQTSILNYVLTEFISNAQVCVHALGAGALPCGLSIVHKDGFLLRTENGALPEDAARLKLRLKKLDEKTAAHLTQLSMQMRTEDRAPEDGRPHNGSGLGLIGIGIRTDRIRYHVQPPQGVQKYPRVTIDVILGS